MTVFLVSYILLYGGLNAYALLRFGQGIPFRPLHWITVSGLVTFLVLLPILMHVFDSLLGEESSRAAAWVAWIWMAWSFWFASTALVVDIWNVGENTMYQWQKVTAGEPGQEKLAKRLRISRRHGAGIGVFVVALASVWGFWEAGRIRVKEIHLSSDKIPAGADPVRIILLSDLHIGRTMRPAVIRKIRNFVNEATPDLLVSTGDFLDAHGERVESILAEFAPIDAPLGKLAVTGNHEYYPGIDESVRLHRHAGFRLLRGEAVALLPWLRIAGVDCPGDASSTIDNARTDEGAILRGGSADAYTILLKHYPVWKKQDDVQRPDLQLSGHIHGGQIFPFGILIRLAYRLPAGELISDERGKAIYITRGAGTWGPPFRLFSPPEIPLFILETRN